MSDYPRAWQAHPSPDELADLHDGVLTEAEAADVRGHVGGCASCAAELAALDEVALLLAEVGAEPVAMPADVAASLDAALARVSVERDAGVPSLDERRERSSENTSKRGRSSIGAWLAGSAAVVVLTAVGFQAINGTGADMSADSGSAATDAESASGGQDGGDNDLSGADAARLAPQRINEKTLPEYARSLSDAAVAPSAMEYDVVRGGCKAYRSADSSRELSSQVRWKGQRAFVVVNRETREVTVYPCDTTRATLYSSTY